MTKGTRILNAIERGDAKAADGLLPLIYEELRLLAAQKLSRESPGQTLQATSLVHEAYIRLVGSGAEHWDNRGHFFAAAAEAMRHIPVESARRRTSMKYGADRHHVNLHDAGPATVETDDNLLTLDRSSRDSQISTLTCSLR